MKVSYVVMAIILIAIIAAVGGYAYYNSTDTGRMAISVSDLPN
ncbi:hypothetical protein [Thermoplasma sp.]|nr:hypothetical protein [Thermoplasma sp.]